MEYFFSLIHIKGGITITSAGSSVQESGLQALPLLRHGSENPSSSFRLGIHITIKKNKC